MICFTQINKIAVQFALSNFVPSVFSNRRLNNPIRLWHSSMKMLLTTDLTYESSVSKFIGCLETTKVQNTLKI